MTKQYRGKTWSTSNSVTIPLVIFIISLVIGVIIFLYNVIFNGFTEYISAILFLSIPLFFVIFIITTQYFYVILTDDKLIIVNALVPFLKKENYYHEIKQVNIERPGSRARSIICIQIITKKSKSFAWRYVIDVIDEKDYPNLLKDIKDKGLLGKIEGMEYYMNLIK